MGMGYSRRDVTVTTPRPLPELEVEREVDFARWGAAVVRRWWLVAAGLVVGAIVGLLVASGGSSTYSASVLLSLGQPLSPGGSVIPSFATSPAAVSQIVSSADVQAQAAQEAGMPASSLRHHVSVVQVGIQTGANASRAVPLVSLTVIGTRPAGIAAAADALAAVVVSRTTAPYVGQKIHTYRTVLANDARQLASVNQRIAALEVALAKGGLAPVDKLVLVSQVDNSEQRQGNLLNQQANTQQELAFSENIESAKAITGARAVKTSARSKSTSLVVGALIGLVLGAILAVTLDGRLGRRARPAV
jgi:uncharacterized protein involved in exopolysaccharide biosynthesis